MKTKLLVLIPLFFLLASLDLPKGWRVSGTEPQKYEMGVAAAKGRDGKNCATIRSVAPKISGFGTLMQYIVPGKYAGKKIRMSAWVKSKDVKGAAGLWIRVDKQINSRSSAFDHMADRPVKGTTDWKRYEIVVDVDELSAGIGYGVLLSGTGQIWFDDVEIEVLDTNKPPSGKIIAEPANLTFEE